MRQEAAILATLFLNFAFWYLHGNALWLPYSLPVNAVLVAIISAALTLLFLALPALAVYRARSGLFGAVECSLGTIPTYAVRICALWFVVSTLVELLLFLTWQLPFFLRCETAFHETLLASTLLMAFLGYTAMRSQETTVTLAKFTNRLGVAFLLAAAIRLYNADPGYSSFSPAQSEFDFQRFSRLASNLAPLGFLAAAFAQRIDSERNVFRTAGLGFAFPLGATLIAVSSINLVTFHSSFYQPSLEPNIAMALWGGAAASAIPGPLLLSMVTNFGAARFVIRSIPAAVPVARLQLPAVVTVLTLTIAVSAWREWTKNFFPPDFEPESVVLAIAAAILSADALHNRPTPPKRIDWPATAAFIAAFALAYAISQSTIESWGHPWLLPAYATAFAITLAGRKLQRTRKSANRP